MTSSIVIHILLMKTTQRDYESSTSEESEEEQEEENNDEIYSIEHGGRVAVGPAIRGTAAMEPRHNEGDNDDSSDYYQYDDTPVGGNYTIGGSSSSGANQRR